MDAEHYRHLVAGLFPCAAVRGRRTAAVAVEHELLPATPRPARPSRSTGCARRWTERATRRTSGSSPAARSS